MLEIKSALTFQTTPDHSRLVRVFWKKKEILLPFSHETSVTVSLPAISVLMRFLYCELLTKELKVRNYSDQYGLMCQKYFDCGCQLSVWLINLL